VAKYFWAVVYIYIYIYVCIQGVPGFSGQIFGTYSTSWKKKKMLYEVCLETLYYESEVMKKMFTNQN